jgi:uncharacterized membrane protein
MAPLFVMLASWLVFRALGAFGAMAAADSWSGALRYGLGVMFLFTAAAHFVPRTREDMVRMVPPRFPEPRLLVALTGVLEFAGAVGLFMPGLSRLAAFGLILLLVVMFPANIHAARSKLMVAGRPATALALRLPLQLLWIAALWWVARTSPAGVSRGAHHVGSLYTFAMAG